MADQKISQLTDYPTPLNADLIPVVDTANTTTKKTTWTNIKATLKAYFDTLYPAGSGTSTGTNTGDETTTTTGALINGATSKTTPVDADYVGLMDSAASNILKKLSWANIKATLKTYFDTLYAPVGGSSSVLSIVPLPATSFAGITNNQMNVNTRGYTGAFILPTSITVNKISIQVVAVAVAGTIKVGIYSEDGQTQQISVTSGTISGTGINSITVSGVALSAGLHWVVIVPVSTTDITVKVWSDGDYLNNPSGKPVLIGKQTVTAGTLPSTFSPTSNITDETTDMIIFRFDN